MRRKVTKIDTTKIQDNIPELRNSVVKIFIDAENPKIQKEIEGYLLSAGRKKVNTIFGCILRGDYIDSIYKREGKGITAIKLKGGKSKNQNIRIYCKEFHKDGQKVVMVTPVIKKVQKNQDSQKILNIIEKIKKLDY